MSNWVRTQFDQVHSIESVLTDCNGPIDLAAGSAVSFVGRMLGSDTPSIGGTGLVVSPGAIVGDANRGLVRYDLATQDVDTVGLYYCKWKVNPPSSSQIQSFPEDSEMTLIILQSV